MTPEALAHHHRPELQDYKALDGQLPSCILGEHEDCPGIYEGWTDALDQRGSAYTKRCSCGCHLPNPWPWEFAPEDPGRQVEA